VWRPPWERVGDRVWFRVDANRNSCDFRLTCIGKTCRQSGRTSKQTFQSSCRPARQGASELYAKSFLDEQVNRVQRMIYATGIASEA